MILSNKGDYNAEYKDLIKAQIRRLQTDPDNAPSENQRRRWTAAC